MYSRSYGQNTGFSRKDAKLYRSKLNFFVGPNFLSLLFYHNELNSSIGTEEEYNEMVAQLHRQGLYQILDIVPNHMGIGETSNGWWMDVLENGPSSLYAPYFDIDWKPLKAELTNKVLLPVL